MKNTDQNLFEETKVPASGTEKTGEEEFDADLFDPDKALRKPRKKKKKKSRKGVWILLVLCLVLAVCAGVLGYFYISQNREFTARKEEAIAQQSDYTTLIDSTSLPEGWAESTLSQLKQQAKDAYDTTYVETLTKAESGDRSAQEDILDGRVTSPDTSKTDLYKKIFSDLKAYPSYLADLLAKDPGMLSFVAAWPEHQSEGTTDAPLTESLDTYPVLSASDPRWGYMPYGNSIMAEDGSAPVVLSMILSKTFDDPELTPVYLANWAAEYGYDKEPVRENDSIFSGAAYYFGVNMSPMNSFKTQVNNALGYGNVVALGLKDGEKTHFILVEGENEDGTWNIVDPLTTEGLTTLNPDDIKDQIDGVYAFWQ